jgi:hypothetical protein
MSHRAHEGKSQGSAQCQTDYSKGYPVMFHFFTLYKMYSHSKKEHELKITIIYHEPIFLQRDNVSGALHAV